MVVGVAVATIFSGGTAELAAGVAVSVGFGGLSLGLEAITGDLQECYTDPWLRVTAEGHQIYPYPWW